jgi:hypothetical protein
VEDWETDPPQMGIRVYIGMDLSPTEKILEKLTTIEVNSLSKLSPIVTGRADNLPLPT